MDLTYLFRYQHNECIMNILKSIRKQSGFTLIELLVVIGILSVLLAITLIAINPSRQFSQANDAKRSSDVSAILNAISQYQVDNKGALPAGIGTTAAVIGNGAGQANVCTDLVPTYIAALPADPTVNNGAQVSATACAGTYAIGYTVVETGGRVTVAAPSAENGPISVTR